MRTRKGRLLAVLAITLMAVVVASAGDEKMAKLKAELSLTDAQVTQLEKRFAELQPLADRAKAVKAELKAFESASSPDQKAWDAKKAEFENIKKEWHAKADAILRSVLTKEQYTKHQAMEAEYKKSAGNKKY